MIFISHFSIFHICDFDYDAPGNNQQSLHQRVANENLHMPQGRNEFRIPSLGHPADSDPQRIPQGTWIKLEECAK